MTTNPSARLGPTTEVTLEDPIQADEDLLEEFEQDSTEVDLIHSRVQSIPALRLERFHSLRSLSLRQNGIIDISHFSELTPLHGSLEELDLYDNLIESIAGIGSFTKLASLDLSFNKIKKVGTAFRKENFTSSGVLSQLYLVQNRISKIDGLQDLTDLKLLELGGNRVKLIENLDQLTSLEELWLGKNKIEEIQNIEHLKKLKILSVPSNRIRTLPEVPLDLPALTDIYLSHNQLSELRQNSFSAVPQLVTLDMSSNLLQALTGLRNPALPLLEEFWFSGNQLHGPTCFESIRQELGGKDHLKTVYFEGNPLQREASATYEIKIRLALPQIKQLDATYLKPG